LDARQRKTFFYKDYLQRKPQYVTLFASLSIVGGSFIYILIFGTLQLYREFRWRQKQNALMKEHVAAEMPAEYYIMD
jgi:hypothetical protein